MKKLFIISIFLITNIANAQFVPINVNQGGTGLNSVPAGSLLVGSTALRLTGTTSPTVGYLTATSTTGSSVFMGKVGIGTSNPLSALQINTSYYQLGLGGLGGPNITANAYYASGWKYLETAPATMFSFDFTGSGDLGFAIAPSGTAGNPISWKLPLKIYNTGVVDDTLVLNTGNVGIGSTTPGTALSIGNTGNNTINISPTATSTFGTGINLRGGCFSVNNVCVGGTISQWITNGTSIYYSIGNVGIGSTTPAAKLSVTGSGLTTGKAFEITDSANSPKFTVLDGGNVGVGNNTPSSLLTLTSGTAPSPQNGFTTLRLEDTDVNTATQNTGGPQITFGQRWWAGNNVIEATGAIRGIHTSAPGQVGGGVQLMYRSTVVDMTPGLTINHLGQSVLGSSLPSASTGRLTLAGDFNDVNQNFPWGTAGVALQIAPATYTANAISGTVANNMANSFGIPTFSSWSNSVTYTNAGTLYIDGAPTAGSHVTITNPFALYINSGNSYFGGSVGIGSTTPSAKLSVTGSGLTTGKAFEITDSANSPKFTVLDSGNVGVGTVSPTQKLDMVAGGAYGYNGAILAQASTTLANWFFGKAGNLTTTGTEQTAVGEIALSRVTTGTRNTAFGRASLYSNTTGNYNSGYGFNTLFSNVSGQQNSAFGPNSLFSNISGTSNVGLGYGSGFSNSTGSYNVFIGDNAGYNSTTTSGAVYIGYQAGYNATSSSANTFIGYQAGKSANTNTNGGGNTALGYQSLYTINITGTNNTALGYLADVSVDGLTNATAIGYNAKVGASNSLILGGTGSYGVNVGIGTTTPNSNLDIYGSITKRYKEKTADYTMDATDNTINFIDGTSAIATTTLPTTVGIQGREYTIKNSDSDSLVIITGQTGQLIDGQSRIMLSSQYQSVTVMATGSSTNAWIIK